MKRQIHKALLTGFVLLFSIACSSDEKYDTATVKDFDLFLNGETWSLNPGITTKPFFIYKNDGDYVANYSSHYWFALEKDTYRIMATPAPGNLIPAEIIDTNLKDLVIHQVETADQVVQISKAIVYKVPSDEKLSLNMINRTGTIRLQALDEKADKTYTAVRARLTTPRSGYKPYDESYVETSMELVKTRNTATGGVNYQDDFIVFQTGATGVQVVLDYLDTDGNVVNTKPIAGSFEIQPALTTLVQFNLNDADTPVIQDYTVTIIADEWEDTEEYPNKPTKVPDGFIYLPATESLSATLLEMEQDEDIEHIKLFLAPGASFSLGAYEFQKSVTLLSEPANKPKVSTGGQLRVKKTDTNPDGPKNIRFEGLGFSAEGAYLFNNAGDNQFNLETLEFIDCDLIGYKQSLFRIQNGTAGTSNIDNFIIDGCLIEYGQDATQSYAVVHGTNSDNNLLRNFRLTNSTMIFGSNTSFHRGFFYNTTGVSSELNVYIENCIIHNEMEGSGISPLFDLNSGSASSISFTMNNTVLSGYSMDRAIRVGGGGTQSYSNNFITAGTAFRGGYLFSTMPTETLAPEQLYRDVNNRDFTINPSSDVYQNNAGDPRWIE